MTSPAAGNAASPEVANRPAIIPGEFQDHAEAAWDAWYEPEQDFARAITTSTHDEMHRAFLAGVRGCGCGPNRSRRSLHADRQPIGGCRSPGLHPLTSRQRQREGPRVIHGRWCRSLSCWR